MAIYSNDRDPNEVDWEKNYAVTGLLGEEDFYVNVYANSEEEAIEKAIENVHQYAKLRVDGSEEEFDILKVEEIK